MTVSPIFGSLVGPWQVEQAVIAHLQKWLDTYMNETERQLGIRPRATKRPDKDWIYGGTDFESYQQDATPAVIVVCQPADSPPNLLGSEGYVQWFEAQVGCVIVNRQNEDETRKEASLYATAVMGALIQQGAVGGISSRTELVRAPRVDYPDPDERLLAVGVTVVNLSVDPIVDERLGASAPDPHTNPPPDPGTRPEVTTTSVTVVGESLS